MTNQIPDTTIKTGLVLAPQVKAMLDKEAYHYCADCHTHCRQTVLAVEATKEAAKAYDALREALQKIRAMFFEDAKSGANVINGKLEHVDNELHPWIPGAKAPQAIAIIDAALSLVDHPTTKEGNNE